MGSGILKKDLKACDSRHDNLSLSQQVAPIMRWCLYIPSLLILLTFGVELCGVVVAKDPAHLACVFDDDDAALKACGLRENYSCTECDPLFLVGQQVGIRWVTPELNALCKGDEIHQIQVGVRRHRWLCRECC